MSLHTWTSGFETVLATLTSCISSLEAGLTIQERHKDIQWYFPNLDQVSLGSFKEKDLVHKHTSQRSRIVFYRFRHESTPKEYVRCHLG